MGRRGASKMPVFARQIRKISAVLGARWEPAARRKVQPNFLLEQRSLSRCRRRSGKIRLRVLISANSDWTCSAPLIGFWPASERAPRKERFPPRRVCAIAICSRLQPGALLPIECSWIMCRRLPNGGKEIDCSRINVLAIKYWKWSLITYASYWEGEG